MDWWIWVVTGLTLFLIEIAIPLDFFLIFIGLGFLVTGLIVASGLIASEAIQFILCAVLSFLFLIFLKPKLQKKLSRSPAKEEYVGEDLIPYLDIEVNQQGKAELRGTGWQVVNRSTQVLKQGQRYKVSRIENLTLIVE